MDYTSVFGIKCVVQTAVWFELIYELCGFVTKTLPLDFITITAC